MFGSIVLAALVFIAFPSINTQFQQFVAHVDSTELTLLNQNVINSFEKLDEYFNNGNVPPGTGTHYTAYDDIDDCELETAYPGYTFISTGYHETSMASGAVPIDFGDDYYDEETIIEPALVANGITSSYAGCGPNAMIGVFDYFARYLGATTIMSDVNDNTVKYNFVSSLYGRCTTYDVSFFAGQDALFMTPWDYKDAFNQTATICGIQDSIVASDHWTVLGMKLNQYWDLITSSIDKGMPVTLLTTNVTGITGFGAHYTNIYGYETMVGTKEGCEPITRRFLKGMLNHNQGSGFYCDARILNDPMIGLITYDMQGTIYDIMHASDTSNVFVNANNGGQYFFDTRMADVSVNGHTFSTFRLRTSYIENQYLVMSPNRVGAGEAYLHIYAPTYINYVYFDAGMWGYGEGISNETFTVEIFINNSYQTLVTYDLSKIGFKENMTSHLVIIPYNVVNIRFRAVHSNPISTTNKGRICLENIKFTY